MGKKYELLKDDTVRTSDGETLYRIRALQNIWLSAYEGQLGGYIQSEDNLSHYGNCWVGNTARVWEDARIFHNARVMDCAEVSGHVRAGEEARIDGGAQVWGCVHLLGHANVCGAVQLGGNVSVCGDARLSGKTRLFNDADICHDALIGGNLDIFVFSDVLGCGSTTMFRTRTFHEHEMVIKVKNAKFFGSLEKFAIQMDEEYRGCGGEETCRSFFAFVAHYFRVKNPLEHI